MKELIRKVHSKNPMLKPEEVGGVLHIIKNTPGLTNNALVRMTGIPKETLRVFKSSISHILKNTDDDSISLKEDLKEDFKPYKWSLVDYSDEKLEGKLLSIRDKYDLSPKREYDQFFADVKTTVSKVNILVDRGMVEGKNILLLGDDDLVSIALGLAGKSFSTITILDIDSELLATIDKISKDLGLDNIHTKVYDARDSLAEDLKGRFDVVVTDPPYTKSGVHLFLRRSVELLSGDDNKYIFMCYGNSYKSPEKTLKIQEVISSYNLLIEDKLDKFNRYYGAESIGSASSMYVLKLTPFTYIPKNLVNADIYTYEKEKEEKFPFVDHFTFKVNSVPKRILNSKKTIQKVFGEFCRTHRLKVVGTNVTKFKGKGLTLNFVLAQSNLTVHTWPEYGALHLVLITCTPIYKKESMHKTLAKLLSTDAIEVKKVE